MAFTFDHVWQLILSGLAILLGWLHFARREELNAMKSATDKAHETGAAASKDLQAHKLFAAETYARKGEVEAQLRSMEERLKESIESSEERVKERLDDIRDRLPAPKIL